MTPGLRTTWISFARSISGIQFFVKQESKTWEQDAESGKQDTNCMRMGRGPEWSK